MKSHSSVILYFAHALTNHMSILSPHEDRACQSVVYGSEFENDMFLLIVLQRQDTKPYVNFG